MTTMKEQVVIYLEEIEENIHQNIDNQQYKKFKKDAFF